MIHVVWGECTHVFHMHCLLRWLQTEGSRGQCPMDRRTWGMNLALYLISLSYRKFNQILFIIVTAR